MPPRYHSAHANLEFDQLMRLAQAGLEGSARADCDFGANVIAARLAQRIVEVGFNPFVAQCAREAHAGKLPPPAFGRRLVCGGIVIDTQTGAVTPTWRSVFAGVLDFVVHSAHIMFSTVRGLFSRREAERRAATVVFGVGAESLFFANGDARFADYCTKGPIVPLNAAKWLVVQSQAQGQTTRPDLISYSRFPLQAVAGRSLTISEFLRLMLAQGAAACRFGRGVIKFPLIAILGRDRAYLPLVRSLADKEKIAAVVMTNSMFASQPLWMRGPAVRNFCVHLIWYSQNTVPTVLAADRLESDLPHYRHLAVDETWLWTEGYAAYLRALGVECRYHVVGPILWYLPDVASAARTDGEIRIAIFDVTPVRDDVALRIGLIHNYYRPDIMVAFLEQIREVGRELERKTGKRVRMLLKHKRGYNPNHDQRYIALVAQLCAQGQSFELVPHQTTIYSLVAETDLSIVVPYSSPAYVASFMGKPAVFFDPSQELLDTHERARHVTFAAAKEELLAEILRLTQPVRGPSQPPVK